MPQELEKQGRWQEARACWAVRNRSAKAGSHDRAYDLRDCYGEQSSLVTISTSITISSERKTQRDPSPITADLLRPAWSLRFVRHWRTTTGCDRCEVAVHPAQTYCNRLFPVLWVLI